MAPLTSGIMTGSRVGGGGSATIPIESASLGCVKDLGLVNPSLLTFSFINLLFNLYKCFYSVDIFISFRASCTYNS